MGVESSLHELNEEADKKYDSSKQMVLDMDAPIKPELLQMLHLSQHEVREIYDTYRRRVKGTNMSYTTFTKIIDQKDYNTSVIFKHFCRDSSVINIYEFIAALIFGSYANYINKLKLLFLIFNFNGTGKLSFEETFIGYKSLIFGYIRLINKKFPDLKYIEQNAKTIFKISDMDPDNALEFEELVEYVDSNGEATKFTKIFECPRVFNDDYRVFLAFKRINEQEIKLIMQEVQNTNKKRQIEGTKKELSFVNKIVENRFYSKKF